MQEHICPSQLTYNLNGQQVAFSELSPELQSEILQAEGFFDLLDNAKTESDRRKILETHPYNQLR